ncbi:hypothetical protein HELRODRAFT_137959, partial [Helobdella robusta]|uniref:IPT/TIG domain-containing protein n=1 Tax=Helobdella robusta TaxID=6412 RepID=T1EIQ2_HELRO
PDISGISPNTGMIIGGTKIIIRGKNLGERKEDIIGLFVCGSNILSSLEYVSSSKILCTTKPWRVGEGVITIETQTGGKSNSTLTF